MFTYYLNPGKYSPAIKQSDITDIMVKDYYTLKPFDARKAYFVTGSNVLGPMGKELIPLAKKADAQEFLTDHKGNRIYRFKEVTAETLKSLE
jgi:nitrous oxide reductase accessory protein NosL